MDGLTLQQFVCEAEVRNIRTAGRAIYREETQARCGDVLQFRIAVANCSLLFFVAAYSDYSIHLIYGFISHTPHPLPRRW